MPTGLWKTDGVSAYQAFTSRETVARAITEMMRFFTGISSG
jgi:hypothetical protein